VLLQLIPAFEWNEREIPRQPLKQSKFHQEAGGLAKGKKKERRRKSGHPSSMSLSEEGSSVSCIALRAGNRSTIFRGRWRIKSEDKRAVHGLSRLPAQMGVLPPYAVAALSRLPTLCGALNAPCWRPSGTIFPLSKCMA